jgi:hypothetical protein
MYRKLEILKRSSPHDDGWIDLTLALDGKLADLMVNQRDLEGKSEAWFQAFCVRTADSLISTYGDYRHQRDRFSALPLVENQ